MTDEGDERLKNARPGQIVEAWIIETNTDLTEGRGATKALLDKVFGTQAMAAYMGRDKGVQGTAANARKINVIVDEEGNIWPLVTDRMKKLVPAHHVEITNDAHREWVENLRKSAAKKLTQEERVALGL